MIEAEIKHIPDFYARDNWPKVSIIIVTYNAAGTLQKCLDSIGHQTYPAIELIIMDGQSTDGTIEILESNSDIINFWKSEKDQGIYDAMNKALDYVTGDWVYFIGADDQLLDDFSAMAFELKNPSAIYYGSVLCRGKKCSGYINSYYQAKVGMYHQSMIYPSSVFKRRKYDLKYRISADYVFNMECHGDQLIEFIYKDYVVAYFNHTGISGLNGDKQLAKDKSALILKNFGLKIWLRYQFRQFKGFLRGTVNRKAGN